MASDRTSTLATRIRVCLFLIELSLAVAMAMSAYVLLKLVPITISTSWTSGIFSTLFGIWVVKTITSLLSHRSAVNEGINGNDDLVCDDENHGLKAFESMRESKMQSYFDTRLKSKCVTFEGEGKEQDNPPASKEITDTKKFLLDMTDENEYTSKISFPLLAVLATALLQCAVRLLVIVQNLRSFLPWRRRRLARNGLIHFSDIPFTIGRSSSGCSFHTFSFLNGWLDFDGDDCSRHGSRDALTDNSMALQAVSFDRTSINSSHFIINPPRKHPAAKSQLSWLGMRFEDIDMSLTILFKRKGRRCGEGDAANDKCIKSITIRFKMKALEIGVFPSPLDWCKGIGIQLDAKAIFDAITPECGKDSSLSGFGVSLASTQLNMHCFSSKDRVVSWDKIQSSLHLHRQNRFPNDSEDGHFRTQASLLIFPSGFVSIHGSEGENETMKPAPNSPLSRRAYINLGDFLCGNRLALGVHLRDMQTILQLMELLLQNMPSFVTSPSAKTDACATNRESKKKTPVEIVELNAVISLHLYTHLSPAHENKDLAPLDYFSFETPHSVVCWKSNVQSEFDAGADQIENNIELMHGNLNPLLVIDTRDVSLRYEAFSGGQLDDSSNTALDLVLLKRIKSKLIRDHNHGRDKPKYAIIDLGGIVARTDGEVTNKLACIKKASEDTKVAVAKMKQTLSSNAEHNVRQNSNAANQNRKQITLSRIEISCDSVDAIMELPGLSENGNIGGAATSSDRVRVALLQGETSVTILRNESSLGEESDLSMDCVNSNLHQPSQLFDSEVKKCGQHHLIQATVAHSEGSVTFYPHSSLPVIDEASPNINVDIISGRDQEVSLYGKVAKLAFESAVPLNSSRTDSVTPPILVSKAMRSTFDSLNIYERYAKRAVIGPSLFSIPVHQFSFCPNSTDTHHNGWPMAQTYALYAAADLVQLAQCKGSKQ
mmetsp:Transcript_12717/g.27637  ORF Transcript_12717/g.27637 Transcript_12717/m.27637 type:complete len:942 (-) Transcript_12717:4-2829(-)